MRGTSAALVEFSEGRTRASVLVGDSVLGAVLIAVEVVGIGIVVVLLSVTGGLLVFPAVISIVGNVVVVVVL